MRMQGMQEIRVGMMEIGMGMQGIKEGMRRIRVGMMGIRVGMIGIRVGMRGTGGGNEANKSENLCIGVELMNYNCRGGQEIRNCVFLVKV